MNHHCVPEFEVEDDYGNIATASASGSHGSGLTNVKKAAMGDERDIIELLWQNGQVVLQSQNQRSPSPQFKKSTNGTIGSRGGGGVEEAEISVQQSQSAPILNPREIRSFDHDINMSNQHHPQQLFMQEDEMASWLHYPIPMDDSSFVDHRDLYPDDLLYPPPPAPAAPSSPPRQIRSVVTEIRPPAQSQPEVTSTVTVAPRPPIPPPVVPEAAAATTPRFQNFSHFSRLPKPAGIASGPSASARELTMVDSSETPVAATKSRVPQPGEGDSTARLLSGENVRCGTATASIPAVGTSTATGGMAEPTVTSSPGASGGSASASASASPEPPPPTTMHNASTSAAVDRKRKGRETDDTECQSEDVEFESVDAKKQARGSTSTKRSRAAEVHNLSERRRRDRINERMKALQELIPRCNKSDKASMLDEAIEYLKSLQLQVQMMSMGCGMFPLMYPGVQQYMPAIGMNMGMEMATNRPIMPYPHLIPTSGMPNPAVAANMGPRFPVPGFHMQPPVPLPDSSRPQASNQLDPMLNSLVTHNPNQPRMPNFPDPYQQFIGLHQAQSPFSQNQVVVQPDKPSSSRGVGNPAENHKFG